ncbi:4Fe-4S binding protein [Thiosocius teredinicola]|uniref:4Fe-4S binding protein n=1 Tax=Thiosocius teredinicola TaxID=1973002 RepID=UPI000990CAEF
MAIDDADDGVDAEGHAWLPTLHAERCVHTHVEVASCDRCVAACPHDAWVLDDEQLAVDTARCDGCGLCVAACPEGALAHDHEPQRRRVARDPVLFAACRHAASDLPGTRVPCVHAFTIEQFAGWYVNGVRRLWMVAGQCEGCACHTQAANNPAWQRLNRLLDACGLTAFEVSMLPTEDWRRIYLQSSPDSSKGADSGRRNFLRRMFATTAPSAAENSEWRPAGVLIWPLVQDRAALHVPNIDVERCSGCDACARVCRHAAIVVTSDPAAYVIDPAACTGCGVCQDVCEQSAIALAECAPVNVMVVPLSDRRCRSCGANYHQPSLDTVIDGRCPVCRHADHASKLFQVV